MSAKYKSPSFLLPNELNTSANTANDTGVNSLYSMNFTGNSGSATLGGLTSTIIQGDLLTISCWYYPTNIGSSDYIIGSGSSSYGPFTLERNAANIRIRWTKSSGTNPVNVTTTDSPMQINLWYHICAIFDTTNSTATDKIQIWINGVRNTTGDVSLTGSGFSSTYASTDTWINRFRINSPSLKTNSVDELAFFNKALTSTEIAALYDGTGSNIRPSNLMATNLNPIAYYPLGEQAQNSGYPSATGNEWQFPNGVLQDYVMDFDGSSDYIDANTTVQSNLDFSVSAWINPASYDKAILGTRPTISAGSSNGFTININSSGNLWGRIFTQSTVTQVQTGSVISLNNWSHIAITYQSSSKTLKTYLNGSEVGSVVGSVSSVASINDLNIGRASIGSSLYSYFNGSISNTQIFNSVIPGTGTNSIETLYNNGSPLTDMSGFTSLTNWWKLNADSVYTPSAPNYTSAVDFDATKTDDLGLSTMSTLATATEVTFSIWAKITKTPISGNNINWLYHDSSGSIVGKNSSGGNFKYEISLKGTSDDLRSDPLPYAIFETWHHVVVTLGTVDAKLYLNGELKDTHAVGTSGNLGVNAFLGRYSNTAAVYALGGFLSNFSIFNSVLSESQVSTLFNFGTPETNISFSPVHHWKLNDINTGLNDIGSLASNNATRGAFTGSGPTTGSTSVAVVPSWKIPNELPIPSANYTTALEFNGLAGIPSYTASYINTNYTGLSGATEFSMSFWLKCDDVTADNSFFGNRNNSNQGISGQINSSTFYTYLQSGANYASFTTASVGVVSGQWFNIVFFYNGPGASNTDRLKIYINENIVTYSLVGTVPSSLDASTQPLWIGSGNRVSNGFGGEISNFALWNTNQLTNLNNIWNLGTPQLSSYTVTPTIWYKMTDTTSGIQDSSGNNNNGTNSNSTKVFSNVVAGNIPVNGVSTTLPSTALQQSDLQFDSPYSNYSLDFDGAGDYIQTGGFTIGNNYSFSCWLKSNTTTPSSMCFLSSPNYYSVGYDGNFVIRFTNATQIQMYSYNERSDSESSTVTIPSIDTNWHHFSLTSNGTTTNIYWDGSPLTVTGNQTKSLDNISQGLIIGDNITGNNNAFNGKIDETAVWNTALTEAQVLEIYNNGKPGDLDNFSGTAPISWWRLGENAYFNTGTTPGPEFTVPNSIAGAPNGIGSGTVTSMLSADAPGTYANGIGDGLAITDRVGDAPLSVANSQSYNMIPDDKIPYVPGYVGAQTNNVYSMTFDGVGDYFESTSINALQNTSNFSISFWVNFNSTSSPTAQQLVSQYSSNNGITIEINAGVFYFVIANGSVAYKTFNLSGNITAGTWYHICMNYDNGSLKGYLNGLEINLSGSVSTSVPANTNPFYIGKILTNNSLNASIDEVAIFDKALTADQIKFDLYEPTALLGGVEKTADIENNTNLPTPVAWYRMGD